MALGGHFYSGGDIQQRLGRPGGLTGRSREHAYSHQPNDGYPRLIEVRQLSQADAAQLFNVTQPRISELQRG
nr:XRE family transcriptional regulator [Pseudomonas syringae]